MLYKPFGVNLKNDSFGEGFVPKIIGDRRFKSHSFTSMLIYATYTVAVLI